MSSIRLDRSQRDAIRREIWLDASGTDDIALGLGHPGWDRDLVLERIERLRGVVALLDAIGWQDQDHGERDVTVDAAAASWARWRADDLRRSFDDLWPCDVDFDALTGLRSIAGAA